MWALQFLVKVAEKMIFALKKKQHILLPWWGKGHKVTLLSSFYWVNQAKDRWYQKKVFTSQTYMKKFQINSFLLPSNCKLKNILCKHILLKPVFPNTNTLVNKPVNMLYFCKTEVQQNFILSWLFLRRKSMSILCEEL